MYRAELRMPVSEKTYKAVALEDPEGHWELHCGVLRRKPGMSFEHSHLIIELFLALTQQLDRQAFAVRPNLGRVRRSSESYYIPDVYVVPIDLVREGRSQRPNALEVYVDPLPLIVEVWSPSTGEYDVESKVPEYQRRGDLEIWRIHPYEHTLTAWRRQPDGSYTERLYTGGAVRPLSLAGVTIDLD
jgi:Uma2 family endonuclease